MKKYDKEFKKEAVKKYLDGQSVASISREIGVNENTKRGAIIHTDHGSQYASVEYRRLLYINGFRQSMSGKAIAMTTRRRRVSVPDLKRN